MLGWIRVVPQTMNRRTADAVHRVPREVITSRTKFQLSKAATAAHILVVLRSAVANIDEISRVMPPQPRPPPIITRRATRYVAHWPHVMGGDITR